MASGVIVGILRESAIRITSFLRHGTQMFIMAKQAASRFALGISLTRSRRTANDRQHLRLS